jgi:transcription-repair coupling factor (superfamily II helicase)
MPSVMRSLLMPLILRVSRNGQVFFVNNRISNLPELADMIHKYVPDCRVAIGHGQMPPEELEKVFDGIL